MSRYVALLRAVNVGGTGKLLMSELASMCRDAGFSRVATYIASGNVVFESDVPAAKVKALLETRLRAHDRKLSGVMVRSASEMQAIIASNPFADTEPKYTYVIFLDAPPPADALLNATGRKDEQMRLGKREIYVHYPSGMGGSKLRIPAAKTGTARNMNTVSKLLAMMSKPTPAEKTQ
jgi:uncharacterized protein (DUF1697 family)